MPTYDPQRHASMSECPLPPAQGLRQVPCASLEACGAGQGRSIFPRTGKSPYDVSGTVGGVWCPMSIFTAGDTEAQKLNDLPR